MYGAHKSVETSSAKQTIGANSSYSSLETQQNFSVCTVVLEWGKILYRRYVESQTDYGYVSLATSVAKTTQWLSRVYKIKTIY